MGALGLCRAVNPRKSTGEPVAGVESAAAGAMGRELAQSGSGLLQPDESEEPIHKKEVCVGRLPVGFC